MTENVSAVVDRLSGHLFASANVSRKAIQEGNLRKVIDPSLSSYVQPFKLPSDSDAWTTNIASIAKNPIDLSIKISTFSKEYLESVLYLETPKKVVQYPSTSIDKPIVRTLKRGARVIKARGPTSTGDDMEETFPSVQPAIKKARIAKAGLPTNFYDVIKPLFDDFWEDKRFDNPQVAVAFFSRISSANCREYGLPSFAEFSSALTVIKDKLKAKSYTSPSEFHLDMYQMFGNITQYFPESHPAVDVARSLKEVFDAKWKTLDDRFVWP
eukprot:gene34294-41508_t